MPSKFSKKNIKKILIIRYRFIGDTVLSTPFIKNVRDNFPKAKIHILVSPNSGELIEENPSVDKVIYLDTTKFHKYEKKSTNLGLKTIDKKDYYFSFMGCVKELKKEEYDLAFVLKRSMTSALLSMLIGAKNRVGFDTEFRSFMLTHPIKYEKNIHENENFLNCLKPLGIKPKNSNPEIFPTEKELLKAEDLTKPLDKFKPKVLIHPVSAHPYKKWPKRYAAKLMDYLYEEFGAQFVFTGATIDKEGFEEIVKKAKHGGRFKYLNLCGKTSLRESFAVYKQLDLAVCADSGNAHLAAAAELPTYVLFGPTRPDKWLPLGKNVVPVRLNQKLGCQPCDVKVKCAHVNCMKLLTPEQVFDKLKLGK